MKEQYRKKLNLVTEDIFDMSPKKEEFDIIISNYLLYHFKDLEKKKIFENISKRLKEGGVLMTECGFFIKNENFMNKEYGKAYIYKDKNLEEISTAGYFEYNLAKKVDAVLSFKTCSEGSGSEYISNHPLKIKLLEDFKNKNENDEYRIVIVGTGNNEDYPRSISKEIEIDGYEIIAIDTQFPKDRTHKDQKVKIRKGTYQNVLNFDGESSKSIDLVKNFIDAQVEIIGIELCKHQMNDKEKIIEKFENNKYHVEKLWDNMIYAKKNSVRNENIETFNEMIDDYLNWRDGRIFSDG